MKKILPQKFYNQKTLKVAQELLGKYLVRKLPPQPYRTTHSCKRRTKYIASIITETEAYFGYKDKASHASRGRTPRAEVMYGQPGFWYIYMIYGMYHCLNIVTEKKDYPAAVLIRAVKIIPSAGWQTRENEERLPKTNGPGKLCRALQIDKSLNRAPAYGKNSQLWIEDRGLIIKPSDAKKSPRLGVDYAGEYKNKLWRFTIKELS